MGPKKDTKGGKGKGKDTSDADDKGKGKGLKAANSINVRHILVCIPFSILDPSFHFSFVVCHLEEVGCGFHALHASIDFK